MAMIYIRTKPGRKICVAGQWIPQDPFVAVTDTPYVRRLITHWEDVEVQVEGREPPPVSSPRARRPEPGDA